MFKKQPICGNKIKCCSLVCADRSARVVALVCLASVVAVATVTPGKWECIKCKRNGASPSLQIHRESNKIICMYLRQPSAMIHLSQLKENCHNNPSHTRREQRTYSTSNVMFNSILFSLHVCLLYFG